MQGSFFSYSTSDKFDGEYTFQGPLLFDEKEINRWDMGVFQDTDGKSYLIMHGGDLYQLSADYKSIENLVIKDITSHWESPMIFKKDGLYYWMDSGLTGWDRNDNYYFTAKSLKGSWTSHEHFAPERTLTWNSQSTFALPIAGSKGTTFMYMGDRWSHPKQYSAATYFW
ncbi:family 43 glycosylhydrolase [Echinicola jeungdonensis]|uniref:Family 43 glycosylhydrolase n=1 Tax=Echinicola jeungdonensis TaxID=709343 RepID=A0ABV5J8A5_9BACT|nr:family 43 glycosylhydrolase [Echinicola jeungdonensis]MDN3669512.1 family 43 glycosylhydrolase [Echinicola jeungdonensis]